MGYMNHEHDFDLERSDWEGMPERIIKPEDKKLTDFLLLVRRDFWGNKGYWNIEEAAVSLVEKMEVKDREEFMPWAEKHFSGKVCALHGEPLVCNEENVVPDGMGDVSASLSRENLRQHLKWFLGEKEWKLIEEESNKRNLMGDKIEGGTAG